MAIRKYRINPHTGKLDRVATPEEIAGDYMEHADFDVDNDAIIDKAESVDDGEGNVSTASQVKDAVTHKDLKNNPHDIELTDFGIATGTVGADIDDAVVHKDLTNNPHTITVEQLGLTTGITASDINDAVAHISLTNNPHVVTVDQLDLATGTVASDVDDAVDKKHTQNSDTKLDDGEANEVTSTDLRWHLDNISNPHSVELTDFGVGTGITGADIDDVISKEHEHSNKTELDKVTDGDHDVRTDNPHNVDLVDLGVGTGIVGSDIDDAVNKKHDRQHSIVDSTDHSDKGDYIDIPYSPTILTGGILSEGTNPGTLKVSALTALLRTTDSTTGTLAKVILAEQDNQDIVITDKIYKVVLEYNGGSPQILIQEATADGKRQINIGNCIRNSSNIVHFTNGGYRFAEGIKKAHHKQGELRKWEMCSSISIADEGSKQFSIASGQFFKGINQINFAGFDSSKTSPDTFTYVYYDGDATGGGEWVYVPNQTEIDVDNYNDIATGLDGFVKYKCDWVFVHPDDGHVYVVYGQDDGTNGEISDSNVPTVPDLLDVFGILIGRIVIDAGVATFYRIEMIQYTTFNPQVVIDHNDNSNKQGGTTDEYYHLTASEHTNKYIQGNELKIKVYEQDTEPDLEDQYLAMWIDTSTGGGTYLLFRKGTGDQVKVALA